MSAQCSTWTQTAIAWFSLKHKNNCYEHSSSSYKIHIKTSKHIHIWYFNSKRKSTYTYTWVSYLHSAKIFVKLDNPNWIKKSHNKVVSFPKIRETIGRIWQDEVLILISNNHSRETKKVGVLDLENKIVQYHQLTVHTLIWFWTFTWLNKLLPGSLGPDNF